MANEPRGGGLLWTLDGAQWVPVSPSAQPPLLLVVISPSRVTVILAPRSGGLGGLARDPRSLTPTLKIHSGSQSVSLAHTLGLKGAWDDTTAMECWGA